MRKLSEQEVASRARRKQRVILLRELNRNLDAVDALKDELREKEAQTADLLRNLSSAMMPATTRRRRRRRNGQA